MASPSGTGTIVMVTMPCDVGDPGALGMRPAPAGVLPTEAGATWLVSAGGVTTGVVPATAGE
jgi:hypothetical protein